MIYELMSDSGGSMKRRKDAVTAVTGPDSGSTIEMSFVPSFIFFFLSRSSIRVFTGLYRFFFSLTHSGLISYNIAK